MSFHKLCTHTRVDRATFKSNSYLGWHHVVWKIQAKRSIDPIHTNRHNRFFEMRDLPYLKASIRDFKGKWGRDSGLKACIAHGIRDITIGITPSFRSGNGIKDPYHGQRPAHICIRVRVDRIKMSRGPWAGNSRYRRPLQASMVRSCYYCFERMIKSNIYLDSCMTVLVYRLSHRSRSFIDMNCIFKNKSMCF